MTSRSSGKVHDNRFLFGRVQLPKSSRFFFFFLFFFFFFSAVPPVLLPQARMVKWQRLTQTWRQARYANRSWARKEEVWLWCQTLRDAFFAGKLPAISSLPCVHARVVVTLRKREGRCVEAVYVGWDGCHSLEAVPLQMKVLSGVWCEKMMCRDEPV